MTVSIQFFKDYPEPTIYRDIISIKKTENYIHLCRGVVY